MRPLIPAYNLEAADFPEGVPVRVVRLDCETFEVEFMRDGVYIIRNRTHFVGGSTVVRTVEAVEDRILRV